MNIYEFLMENWAFIIVGLCIVCFTGYKLYKAFTLPTDKQIDNLKEWLKLAVSEAESYLGSGTGVLKLRYVYNKATVSFPWVTRFITFEMFSMFVDEALEWMKEQMSINKNVNDMITKSILM